MFLRSPSSLRVINPFIEVTFSQKERRNKVLNLVIWKHRYFQKWLVERRIKKGVEIPNTMEVDERASRSRVCFDSWSVCVLGGRGLFKSPFKELVRMNRGRSLRALYHPEFFIWSDISSVSLTKRCPPPSQLP
jgi:hypothetical protein